jgi:HEPN domain-containing protein
MPLDAALVAETRSWLVKAEQDLRAAQHALTALPALLEDAVFHCQQAVEKTLKAFLTWHERPFRKTHNLIELGMEVALLDRTLEPLLRGAAPLTEYAWKFRYPGDPEEPNPEEASAALALAKEVFAAAMKRLPEDVMP